VLQWSSVDELPSPRNGGYASVPRRPTAEARSGRSSRVTTVGFLDMSRALAVTARSIGLVARRCSPYIDRTVDRRLNGRRKAYAARCKATTGLATSISSATPSRRQTCRRPPPGYSSVGTSTTATAATATATATERMNPPLATDGAPTTNKATADEPSRRRRLTPRQIGLRPQPVESDLPPWRTHWRAARLPRANCLHLAQFPGVVCGS
jgi:hypothetical protein